MKLRLYRGIATDPRKAEEIINSIKQNGLTGTEGSWKFFIPSIIDVRKTIDRIFTAEKPSKDEIFAETLSLESVRVETKIAPATMRLSTTEARKGLRQFL